MTKAPTNSPSPSQSVQARMWAALLIVSVVLPWLNPFSSGPSPNTVPLLISGFCALALAAGFCVLGLPLDRRTTQVTLFSAWLLAALVSSAVGLAQYFGVANGLAPWVNPADVGQAFANLRQRNQFASLTSIGLASLLFLAVHFGSTRTNKRSVVVWIGIVLAIGLLAAGNAASASRTGALQWAVVVVLALVWSRPQQRRGWVLATGAFLFYCLAVFVLPAGLSALTGHANTGLLERLNEPSGCESRRVLWANVLELIAEKPWLGWGWGELKFAHFSHGYSGQRFCAILDNAHNLPLHWGVELGLPAVTVLMATLGWAVWRGKPWRETDAARQWYWGVLAIIAVHSLVEYPLWYGPFQMTVGLCIWILWRPPTVPPAAQPPTLMRLLRTPLAPAMLTVALLCNLLFLVYATWDYTRVSQLYLPHAQRLAMFQTDTLRQAQASWLFAHEVQFAELTTAARTDDAAERHYTMARALMHFSPEPRVLQILLESAHRLGVDDASTRHITQQFRSAYPADFAKWRSTQQPEQSTWNP